MQLLSVSSSRGSGAVSSRLSSSCGVVGSSLCAHHPIDATPTTTTTTATATIAAAAATTALAAGVVAGAATVEASLSSDSSSDWDDWSDTQQPVSTLCCVIVLVS